MNTFISSWLTFSVSFRLSAYNFGNSIPVLRKHPFKILNDRQIWPLIINGVFNSLTSASFLGEQILIMQPFHLRCFGFLKFSVLLRVLFPFSWVPNEEEETDGSSKFTTKSSLFSWLMFCDYRKSLRSSPEMSTLNSSLETLGSRWFRSPSSSSSSSSITLPSWSGGSRVMSTSGKSTYCRLHQRSTLICFSWDTENYTIIQNNCWNFYTYLLVGIAAQNVLKKHTRLKL